MRLDTRDEVNSDHPLPVVPPRQEEVDDQVTPQDSGGIRTTHTDARPTVQVTDAAIIAEKGGTLNVIVALRGDTPALNHHKKSKLSYNCPRRRESTQVSGPGRWRKFQL